MRHLLVWSFILCCTMGRTQTINISEYSQIYFDTTHELSCSEIHQAEVDFTKNERTNLGVIEHPVWLRLNLDHLHEFGDFKYLVVGNQRTFALSHFVVDSLGIVKEIEESLVKFQHVLSSKDLEGQAYLYVVGNDLYVPTYMHVYLLKTENDLLNFHNLNYYTSLISMIILLISCLGTLYYYFVSKDPFYIYYSVHAFGFFGFLLLDSGFGLLIVDYPYLNLTAIIANFIYFLFSLPLMFMSRFSSRKITYKTYYRYLGILVLFNILILALPATRNLFVYFLIIQFISCQTIITFLAVRYGLRFFDSKEQKWFYFLFLFSMFFTSVKAVQNMGHIQNYEFAEPSFNLVIIIEFLLWWVYIIMSINKDMKEKYLLQKQVAELAQSTKYAIIEGQENERNWVGKKLHDDIGSDLSAIRMMLSYDKEKAKTYLADTIEKVKSISKKYAEIENHDQVSELINFIQLMNETVPVSVSFERLELLNKLSVKNAASICSAIKELINNAIKHGSAEIIFVKITGSKESMTIYVIDNGLGFSEPIYQGIGLDGLQESVKDANVKIDILSSDKGSEVKITLQS